MSLFCCCCDKMPWLRQLEESLFGLLFQGDESIIVGGMAAGARSQDLTSSTASKMQGEKEGSG